MNEKLNELLRKPLVIPTTVGVLGSAGGFALGYILGKRNCGHVVHGHVVQEFGQLEIDFDAEREEAPERRKFVIPAEEFEQLTQEEETMTSAEELISAVDDRIDNDEMLSNARVLRHEIEEETELMLEEDELEEALTDPEAPVVSNIFDGNDPNWNYGQEIDNRGNKNPYIIHRDEYFGEEMGFAQSTLTYYEGDEVLADESNQEALYGYESYMGPLKFGHGSGDQNVVYIRNERLEHEWEVLRSTGRYEIEVLGMEIDKEYSESDLKHSAVRKFREE